jgi:membrane peptidoglycan carboxypeptidase
MFFYGNPATQIWKNIMQPIHEGLEIKTFHDPIWGAPTNIFGDVEEAEEPTECPEETETASPAASPDATASDTPTGDATPSESVSPQGTSTPEPTESPAGESPAPEALLPVE